jgi:DNA mismatch repair protein MutL
MKEETGFNPKIHVLDEVTVTKIAAGEVIERPASVVKELVENAIDAGAARITVEVFTEKRTVRRMRVTDDGTGMVPGDAVLAFTPHATSKIRTAEDLTEIGTLGFRGEALASIGAVARVTLITKPRGYAALQGTKHVTAGGVTEMVSETGAPEGTSVTVEDLFFNTPARKKFQKSVPTELAHIQRTVEGIALARPETGITLSVNGEERLRTDGHGRLRDTIFLVYGKGIAEEMIPVRATFPALRMDGYLSHPSHTLKTPARLVVVINRRNVYSRQILEAVREGYGTLLPRDRFPVGVLRLEIDSSLVDVNVHPTKRQVRISGEGEILGNIRDAVEKAFLSRNLVPDAPLTRERVAVAAPEGVYEGIPSYLPGARPAPRPEPLHTVAKQTDRQLRQTELPVGRPGGERTLPAMQVIGQYNGAYIIAATEAGDLLLIDQHAAHERVLYELVREQEHEERSTQELLVPLALHRPPAEAALLREILPALESEGFMIEEFGKDTFLVRTVPIVLGRLEDPGVIDEILQEILAEEAGSSGSRERIARVVACRGAVKAGAVCSGEQCRRIVDQLARTKNPFTCPHGRPTVIRFTRPHLDAMFKRT